MKQVIWQNGQYITLNPCGNTTDIQNKLIAGPGITITGNVISCDIEIIKIVSELPIKPDNKDVNKIFLILTNTKLGNIYTEYIWVDNKWEILGDLKEYDDSELRAELNTKQPKLVNQQNIKSINGESLLQSGNLELATKADIGQINTLLDNLNGEVI